VQMETIDKTPAPGARVPVLLVSAQHADRARLRQIMGHGSWRLHMSATSRDALALLRQHRIPVVICDSELTDGDWKLLLIRLSDLPDPPRLIVSSRLADERLWAEVLNFGGHDVLSTPFDPREVLRAALLAWQSWNSSFGREENAPEAERIPPCRRGHAERSIAAIRACS
jgi:DNA-binding response OmpR family regulator